jgi:hypothetical protein
MVIEVLYVPGCPNHQAAIDRLRNALRSAAIDAPIQEIAVTDDAMARQLKFPGSPTIRVDGRDVESNAQDSYGLACRLYSNGTGVPSLDTLRRAVAGAQQGNVCKWVQ